MNKKDILKQYFGYSDFRQGQEEIIDAALGGKDAVAIMPTGGGKSICYQIPALMLEGITFVISPLISLMKDQVMALKAAGVRAAYINSSLTVAQIHKVYENIKAGMYKIVYIAPERLDSESFCTLCAGLDISFIAVDEAHCISEWGQDFRPSYLKIVSFLEKLDKRPPIAAFTATATRVVKEDIIRILKLKDPVPVTTGFDRPNLNFEVISPESKIKAVEQLVSERSGRCGIIYCATRNNVEKVCEHLKGSGINATRYHAGLSDAERKENQEAFIYDEANVMVATNAFGMGINKSNVNYVIHYNMPLSVEAYYQEAGRAGRDGEKADCILMFNPGDLYTANMLVRSGGQNEELSMQEREELLIKDLKRLNSMIEYCRTTRCLRGCILEYFGQEHEEKCNNCSNCRTTFVEKDITREAQMVMSCIKRAHDFLGFSLGKGTIIGILSGSKIKRIAELKLDTLSTYGLMSDIHRSTVREIVDFLETEGYIFTDESHGGLMLSKKSAKILFEGETIVMPFKEMPEKKKDKKKKHTEEVINDGLYEALRSLRARIAAKEKVPAYIVFSNATLADMAAKAPKTKLEFLEVSGVGEVKAERYAKEFLEVIIEYTSKE